MDWHQTGQHVIVSIFAKKYDPDSSFVKMNPIRLTVELFFPEENSKFNLDMELRGVSKFYYVDFCKLLWIFYFLYTSCRL